MKINSYDRCVANKVIEVTQCNIAWYVDDNRLLHKHPEVISDIINEVNNCFGEISVVRGNNNTFLVMNTEIRDITIQDVVQPHMSPTISFSGKYKTPFIYFRNRAHSQ